jgi:2'-5' RNA ligase
MPDPTLRLFIAVDLPARVRQEVAAVCGDIDKARWVKRDQLHVTLRFMGKTPVIDLPRIRHALDAVAMPSFSLALHGVGIFPRPEEHKRPRVLWVGIDPSDPILRLKQEIDRVLGPDAQMAKQVFSPHLTLARFAEPPGDSLTRFLEINRNFRSVVWPVASFQLYRSTLSKGGAEHHLVASYTLAEIIRSQ